MGRNGPIVPRILTFFPRKSREIGRFFREFAPENPAKFCFFFREISEALLSGVPILTEEVRRSGLKAEGYLEAKGIFLFINLYLCNTGLDNQLLSSVSEFTQRRPQFLPLSGLWVSSAST